jgi:hypothetical protein
MREGGNTCSATTGKRREARRSEPLDGSFTHACLPSPSPGSVDDHASLRLSNERTGAAKGGPPGHFRGVSQRPAIFTMHPPSSHSSAPHTTRFPTTTKAMAIRIHFAAFTLREYRAPRPFRQALLEFGRRPDAPRGMASVRGRGARRSARRLLLAGGCLDRPFHRAVRRGSRSGSPFGSDARGPKCSAWSPAQAPFVL